MVTEKEAPRYKFPLSPGRAIVSAVGIYVASQIIAVGMVAFYGSSRGLEGEAVVNWLDTSIGAKFAVYLLIAGIAVAAIGAILRYSRETWQSIGLKKPQPKDALYAIVGYGYYLPLFFIVSIVIGVLFPGIDFDQEQQLGFSTSLAGLELTAVFVSLVVLPPLYEEILTRGLLYTGLRSSLKFLPAALVTSALFAVAHLQWGSGAPLLWAAAIDTFILSMVLVMLREKTGSLWPAIGLHAIKNLVAFMLLFVFKVS